MKNQRSPSNMVSPHIFKCVGGYLCSFSMVTQTIFINVNLTSEVNLNLTLIQIGIVKLTGVILVFV